MIKPFAHIFGIIMILQAKEVIDGVKKIFIERLKKLDWMDEATKRKGADKVC